MMNTRGFTTSRIVILAVALVALVFLALMPQWYRGYYITLLVDVLKFVVLTVAWVMFSGPSGYMSLAIAAFYGLGFYIAAIFSGDIPFFLIIIVAGVVAFFGAGLVGALTLRLRGVYFAIFTFGLVELARNVVLEVERAVTGTRGRFVQTVPTTTVFYAILMLTVLTLLVAFLLKRSRYGLALQSIGQYEEAAAHSGIDVVRIKVLTFALSASFMGMAGSIIATRRTYIDPGIAFDLNHSFLPVLMAMFGGMSNLVGPVIGAAVFTYIGEILLTRFPDLYMLIFGIVLVIAILFMPNGIIGVAQQAWSKIRGGHRAPA